MDHRGRYYTVDGVRLRPTPAQRPRIPIVVGGLWPSTRSVVRGARWDGIVPHFPGDGVLPPDGTPPEEHVRAVVEHYRRLEPVGGEILLPLEPPARSEAYVETCRALGATWLYTTKRQGEWLLDPAAMRAGPPVPSHHRERH